MNASKWLMLIASAALSAAVTAIGWGWSTSLEVRLLRAELTQLKSDQRTDQEQNAHIKSLWRYGGFLHEQIDLLRFKAGLPPANKPNLE